MRRNRGCRPLVDIETRKGMLNKDSLRSLSKAEGVRRCLLRSVYTGLGSSVCSISCVVSALRYAHKIVACNEPRPGTECEAVVVPFVLL